MKQHFVKQLSTIKWMFTVVALVALNLGLVDYARAYDTASSSDLPKQEQQGEVTFMSGGIGLTESQAIQREASRWPLALQFAETGGGYLADIQVTILDAKNTEVLKAKSEGPYMLVRLRPGRYTLYANYQGNEIKRIVNVPSRKLIAFYWKD